MSVSFYPSDKELDFELNVSVFNAELIFKMLSVEGQSDQGTVGRLNTEKCKEALENIHAFTIDHAYEVNPLLMDRNQYTRYVLNLSLLLGLCIGRNCEFCWS